MILQGPHRGMSMAEVDPNLITNWKKRAREQVLTDFLLKKVLPDS